MRFPPPYSPIGPEDSPYPYYTVPENIVENQNNSFYDNTYTSNGMDPGFVSFNQGNVIDWSTWAAGTSSAEYTGNPPWRKTPAGALVLTTAAAANREFAGGGPEQPPPRSRP